jgi:hypothetical protein
MSWVLNGIGARDEGSYYGDRAYSPYYTGDQTTNTVTKKYVINKRICVTSWWGKTSWIEDELKWDLSPWAGKAKLKSARFGFYSEVTSDSWRIWFNNYPVATGGCKGGDVSWDVSYVALLGLNQARVEFIPPQWAINPHDYCIDNPYLEVTLEVPTTVNTGSIDNEVVNSTVNITQTPKTDGSSSQPTSSDPLSVFTSFLGQLPTYLTMFLMVMVFVYLIRAFRD